jgi:hypothetical protein
VAVERKKPSLTDSAGRPWAGRSFAPVAGSTDDGAAPPALLAALDRFRAGEATHGEVVDALRGCRLFVPLVAKLAEESVTDGVRSDKRAELSIVTVAGPDGRNVLPAFSSVDTLQHWNPRARPVAQQAELVALAAASDGTDLVVLDATSATEHVLRRPALWAIAQSRPWVPCFADPEVLGEFVASVESEQAVVAVQLAEGDPQARLAGPELIVVLTLRSGLLQTELDALVARLQRRWAASAIVAARVDSMDVRLLGQS